MRLTQILLFILFLPIAASGQDLAVEAFVDSLFAMAYPSDGPGAVVLVARGDEVLARRAYGMADLELGVELRPDHVFRLASVTKQFTAAAVLLLVEDGLVSTDDPITKYFPDWPTHGHTITVEHLLTHTSGLASHTNLPIMADQMRRDLPLADLINSTRDEPIAFAPGTDWSYNNSAYLMLGAIIEQVGGVPYEQFMRERLFAPLVMPDTRYGHDEPLIPRRVPGYVPAPAGGVANAPFLSMHVPHAAGALVSTVDDLHRWNRAIASGELMQRETIARAFAPFILADGRSTGYGFGWGIGSAAGRASIEHGGDIPGFATETYWIPDEDLFVAVLSNAQRNYANPGPLARAVIDEILGRPTPLALSDEELEAYTGVYAISDTERRAIYREGSTLYSVRGAGERFALAAIGPDTFEFAESRSQAVFERDAAGAVVAMRVIPRAGVEQQPALRTDADVREYLAAVPPPVEVAPEFLDAYAGRYQLAPEFIITVRRTTTGLEAQATGQPPFPLSPRSESRFEIAQVAAAIEFERDASGAVAGLLLEQAGQRIPGARLAD